MYGNDYYQQMILTNKEVSCKLREAAMSPTNPAGTLGITDLVSFEESWLAHMGILPPLAAIISPSDIFKASLTAF